MIAAGVVHSFLLSSLSHLVLSLSLALCHFSLVKRWSHRLLSLFIMDTHGRYGREIMEEVYISNGRTVDPGERY